MDKTRTRNLLKSLLKKAILVGDVPWLSSELVDIDSFAIREPIGRPLPIHQVLSIYKVRAALAKKMAIDVQGYDAVLRNLSDAPAGDVEIISMVDRENSRYLAFLSSSERKLFGIVRFPPHRRKQTL